MKAFLVRYFGPMATCAEILRLWKEHHSQLVDLGVQRLGIFGSVARGEAGPESDVDVLVELDQRTFDRYMDLKIFLEDLLGRRVDLLLYDRIKPHLRERILAEVVDAA